MGRKKNIRSITLVKVSVDMSGRALRWFSNCLALILSLLRIIIHHGGDNEADVVYKIKA